MSHLKISCELNNGKLITINVRPLVDYLNSLIEGSAEKHVANIGQIASIVFGEVAKLSPSQCDEELKFMHLLMQGVEDSSLHTHPS